MGQDGWEVMALMSASDTDMKSVEFMIVDVVYGWHRHAKYTNVYIYAIISN